MRLTFVLLLSLAIVALVVTGAAAADSAVAAAAARRPRMHAGRFFGEDSMLDVGLKRHLAATVTDAASAAAANPPTPPAKWFEQKLNHNDDQDARTWKQRYFVNAEHYVKGGPVFIQIGGEGTANPIWTVMGQMVNYGKKEGALLLLLEHRFYGESHPLPDLSVDSLKYLSSEQALQDLAAFHGHITTTMSLPPQTRWVCFGGSYPGALSAWFRTKFPHLVVGAIASSAPVEPQVDFQGYYHVVSDSLTQHSGQTTQCVDGIADAVSTVDKLMKTAAGRAELSKTFDTCAPLTMQTSDNDLTNFYSSIEGVFAGVVQYNRDNRAFEGAANVNITVSVVCGVMNNAVHGPPLKRLARVNAMLSGGECLDYSYDAMITELKNTSLSSPAAGGSRQWLYQTCTEFGYYQTSDWRTSGRPQQGFPFSHMPLAFSLQQCTDIFGPQFTPASLDRGVARTSMMYGGKQTGATRIVFVNGDTDPWHWLGVTTDAGLADSIYPLLISGTAHCANQYPSAPDDPVQLVQARREIYQRIRQWVRE